LRAQAKVHILLTKNVTRDTLEYFVFKKFIEKNCAPFEMKRFKHKLTAVVFCLCCKIEPCNATPPLALHQLIEVEQGGEVVITLRGHDVDGDTVSAAHK
jgi:hypothetical protein